MRVNANAKARRLAHGDQVRAKERERKAAQRLANAKKDAIAHGDCSTSEESDDDDDDDGDMLKKVEKDIRQDAEDAFYNYFL